MIQTHGTGTTIPPPQADILMLPRLLPNNPSVSTIPSPQSGFPRCRHHIPYLLLIASVHTRTLLTSALADPPSLHRCIISTIPSLHFSTLPPRPPFSLQARPIPPLLTLSSIRCSKTVATRWPMHARQLLPSTRPHTAPAVPSVLVPTQMRIGPRYRT